MAVLMEFHEPVQKKTMKIVDKKKLYFLEQQLKLAKDLASNDENTRRRTLKYIKKWFEKRSEVAPFTKEDFQIIWKGLFYCMWMSDKALVQEEYADTIAKLIHLPTVDASILFFEAGLTILINEWFGIDQLRLDKFLMLVRRLLREMLTVLRKAKFRKSLVVNFSNILSGTILSTTVKPPIGLFMHFVEIFLEELAKVSRGHIHNDRLMDILKPFVANMVASDDGRLLGYLRKHIFTYLIRQSDLGLEYQAKYEAWRAQGFPGSIAAMQKIPLDEDERMSSDEDGAETSENMKETALDPRAGRVNVELPQIKFNPKSIVSELSDLKFDKNSTTKSRKIIKVLIEQFTKLAAGKYPLGINKIERMDMNLADTNVRKAAKRLIKFEQKLLGKNKKRRSDKEPDNDEIQGKRRKIDEDSISQKIKKGMKRNVHEDKPESSTKTTNNHEGKKARKQVQGMKKEKSKNYFIPDDIECVFERNSGTWVVYEIDEETNKNFKISPHSVTLDKSSQLVEVPSNSGYSNSSFTLEAIPVVNSPRKVKNVPDNNTVEKVSKDSPQIKSAKKQKPFPNSGWDEPLKEGEYEIFVPAKKQFQKLNKTIGNTPIKSIKGKSRLSLDPGFGRNPFSKSSTPNNGSAKKVKINVKLNMSQEIHEHEAQILSSPGIPWDASKKPMKPLLKGSSTPSPLNPFYKK